MNDGGARRRHDVILACRVCTTTMETTDIFDWTLITFFKTVAEVRVAVCPHVPDELTVQVPNRRRQ